MKTFEDVVDFLKKAGTYYLATDDRGQPRVRPFGTAHVFEGRLYIQTGKKCTFRPERKKKSQDRCTKIRE